MPFIGSRSLLTEGSPLTGSTPPTTPKSRTVPTKTTAFSAQHQDDLLRKANAVVRNRQGAVMTRHTILKADWFRDGLTDPLGIRIQGAPNFRQSALRIFGVGQCSQCGIATILTWLRDAPNCLWLSTREEPLLYIDGVSYVLREWEYPLQNSTSYQGISAQRLEQMENRLKLDVISEVTRHDGLLLVHVEDTSGHVIPSWVAPQHVQTQQDLLEDFRARGFAMTYARIPIAPEEAPDHAYLDEYVRHIKPLGHNDAIVVNCGMGGGRTTFGMIVASLVRRSQMMLGGAPDPLQLEEDDSSDLKKSLREAEKQTKAVLRLMYILERGLEARASGTGSAIEWALERGTLIDDLKSAVVGDYHLTMELSRLLDNGHRTKKALDGVIDLCDQVVNVREEILMHRLRQSLGGPESNTHLERACGALERYFCLLAFSAYINTNAGSNFQISFFKWLQGRQEIWSLLQRMRWKKSDRLALFRPVAELNIMRRARTLSARDESLAIAPEMERYVARKRAGAMLLANNILKVDHWGETKSTDEERPTIEGAPNFRRIPLFWIYAVAQPTVQGMKRVLDHVRSDIDLASDSQSVGGNAESWPIKWINLREEPLVYINGVPYVLRDTHATLRNLKSFSGITSQRLGILEARLKEDVVAELQEYDSRIMLHNETAERQVVATWENASAGNIETLEQVIKSNGDGVHYTRIPVTAEDLPELADFDALLQTIVSSEWQHTVFIMNCQVGLGRSTMGTIVSTLVIDWLNKRRDGSFMESTPSSLAQSHNYDTNREPSNEAEAASPVSNFSIPQSSSPILSAKAVRRASFNVLPRRKTVGSSGFYTPVNTLLRVIRHGLECKQVVDSAVDLCSQAVNIRDSIEELRLRADGSEITRDEQRRLQNRAMLNLRRYFLLIVFQAYLDSMDPSSPPRKIESFRNWVSLHPEILTMKKELDRSSGDSDILLPVWEQLPGDGVALSSEVISVLAGRQGSVIGRNMIIKHDYFPGSQKFTLQERIKGAQNFRRISLHYIKDWFADWIREGFQRFARYGADSHIFAQLSRSGSRRAHSGGHGGSMQLLMFLAEDSVARSDESLMERDFDTSFKGSAVCGVGMPTTYGVENVLSCVHATKQPAIWTSLREEPVLYIKGKPFVLREAASPVKNLVATGIARERVERMEAVMKKDALKELKKFNGRILLHEEHVTDSGNYAIVPLWESVLEEEIMTSKELFSSVAGRGFNVSYLRVPITDEQAPIPAVVDELISRVLLAPPDAYFIFNCQQGRGRTSTGMVICCLVQMILSNASGLLKAGQDVEMGLTKGWPNIDTDSSQEDTPADRDTEGESSDSHDEEQDYSQEERQRLLRGEYRLILQLVAVLEYGKLAKFITDVAINVCSHMQNLREAVYQLKLRILAAAPGTRHTRHLIEAGYNYLVRYFYLIALTGYLIDRVMKGHVPSGQTDSEGHESFQAWLHERRELTNILKNGDRELT